MAKISSKEIAGRFRGRGCTKVIRESLLMHPIVCGRADVADALQAAGKVYFFRAGETITEQGSADNEIYFILSGAVSVLINGYEVATRAAGTHVGEMAVMDYTAKRSASIVATDDVVVLEVGQQRFFGVADGFPIVWQCLARELAARLRERSKFLRKRNPLPTLFIGSSSEGRAVASVILEACTQKLKKKITPRLWSDGVFQASQTVIEDLLQMSDSCDFAVLILTPDDETKSRGNVKVAPRDNVIYELGLFTGSLGRKRSLIVVPSGIELKIPTDLLGVTTLRYRHAKTTSALRNRLEGVVESIVSRIKELGPR